jgi:hypothetical protein
MRTRLWVGVAAGAALGLGAVVAVEASTDEASAQRPVAITVQQLKINQRISQAAVRRSNESAGRLNAIEPQLPLWAVSSGVVGSNLVRGDGAVAAQRIDEGNYRVKFNRNIAACTWSATLASDTPPVPDGQSIRLALDTTDAGRTQLVVRTANPAGQPVNSGFHVQVFC